MFKRIKDKLFGVTKNSEASVESSNTKPILMYSTRFCPYCMRAKSLLAGKGWTFEEIPVDSDPSLRAQMMEKSGRHTVPQIWIGDMHVGGCDELYQLEREGRLDSLVAADA